MEPVVIKNIGDTVTVAYGGKALGNTSPRFGNDAETNFAKFTVKFPGKTAYVMPTSGKDNIVNVDSLTPEKLKQLDADALITEDPSALLVLKAADCIPLVFYVPGQQILALAHVGRRGAALHLPTKVIQALGCDPQKLHCYLGPSISKESYWFKKEEFENRMDASWDNYITHEADGVHINGLGYVLDELKKLGVKPANIEVETIDTGANSAYFSEHRHKLTGEPDGRNTFGVHLK